MVKRGFAFEKVFKKKVVLPSTPTKRSHVTFSTSNSSRIVYRAKPAFVKSDKKRLQKFIWQPKFKSKSLNTVATPLIKTGIAVVLLLLIYGLFGSHVFILTDLKIQGNRLVDAKIIETTIFKNGFKPFNALVFNEAKATKQVLTLTQIKSVDFRKHISSHQLEIIVEEHETSLIWQTNSERFLVNRAGVVYDIAPPDSPITVVEDLKNVPVNLKQQILTTDFIEFVNFVAANLPRKTTLTIRQIIVPETTFELEVVTNENWKIIFDTTKSPDTQLSNLVKILDMGAKPRQYVDLRIIDRIYYK